MTDGIGRLSGYGYGIGGFMPRNNKEEVAKDNQQQAPVAEKKPAETQVDPSKVMEFLANNNFFVAPQAASKEVTDVEGAAALDSATQDRVAGYMEQFEMIQGIVQEEFGEEMAPAVMDVVMDKLMGMAA